MITPPTKSFFVIHVHNEATDMIANRFSPSTAADIRESVLISDDYPEDIQAYNEMDRAVASLQKNLEGNIVINTLHNPLYYPSTQEQIDAVLEGSEEGETFRFVGMDGNPFTMKSVTITLDDEPLIEARVACHQFDLPTYSEIIEKHKVKLN